MAHEIMKLEARIPKVTNSKPAASWFWRVGIAAAMLLVAAPLSPAADAFRILVFSKTLGFRHGNIPLGN